MGLNEERELLSRKIDLCLLQTQELQSIASQLLDYNPYELADVMEDIIDCCESGRTAFEKAAAQAEQILMLIGWGRLSSGVSAASGVASTAADKSQVPANDSIKSGIANLDEAKVIEQLSQLESSLEIFADNSYNLLKSARIWLKNTVKTTKNPQIAMMVFGSLCNLASGAGGVVVAQAIPFLNKVRFAVVSASFQATDKLDQLKDTVELLQKLAPPSQSSEAIDSSNLCSSISSESEPDYTYNDAYKFTVEEDLKRREEEFKRRDRAKS